MAADKNAVLNFWNECASLKERAGTNDLIAKQLEIEAIAKYVGDGQRILEVGCGNGITAAELAARFAVDIIAVDYAGEMIAEAQELHATRPLKGQLAFGECGIENLAAVNGEFDLVYTERVLINLPDWNSQRQAIEAVGDKLRPGGKYIMCENSQDGLDGINAVRAANDLPVIVAPWHNRYMIDAELQQDVRGLMLIDIDYYSSTYYFLSRIVNAAVARQEGREPAYDSAINKLALSTPALGSFGQGRIWVWEKQST